MSSTNNGDTSGGSLGSEQAGSGLCRNCTICNKSFSSGKALGGHMRMHVQASKKTFALLSKNTGRPASGDHRAADQLIIAGDSRNVPTCYSCGRNFPTMKSLFGHMRSHPERPWRGIQPPPKDFKEKSMSSSPDSGSALDLSMCVSGWSVTAKRGRKRVSSSADSVSGSGPDSDDEMEEAVHELLLLASGTTLNSDESNTKSKTDSSIYDDHSDGGLFYRPVTGAKAENQERRDFERCRIETAQESHSRTSEGSSPDRPEQLNPEGVKIMQRKKRRQVKLADLEPAGDAALEPKRKQVPAMGNGYKCSVCGKTFPTPQALGGHTASHNKFKSIQNMNDDAETAAEDPEDGRKDVGLATLRLQTISAGQHCNWSGREEAQSSPMMSAAEGSRRVLNIDLNELPALDNDDGVESFFFMVGKAEPAGCA